MGFVDFYALLGIEQTAEEQAIRAAVRKTRGRYRQQAGSPSQEQRDRAEQMLARIAEAEAILENARARQAYDAQLAGRRTAPPPQRQPGAQKEWLEAAADYLDAGEIRNAAGAAREATRVDPEDPQAWQLRARASLAQKDFNDAEFAATETIRLKPRDGVGFGLRGDVLRAEGRHAEAEDAYRAAADVDPADPTWPAQVAYSLIDQDRPQEAVAQARQLVVEQAGSQYARDVLSRVLIADCKAAMSNNEEGGAFIASKKQVGHIDGRLGEIDTLAPWSEPVRPHLESLRVDLAAAKSRRFLMPTGNLVLWVFGWIVVGLWLSWLLLSMILGPILGFLAAVALNVGLGAVLLRRVYPQRWQMNRDVLGDWARTGL